MEKTEQIAEVLIARVEVARRRLADAADTADLAGVASALDELETAHGLARKAGITVPRPATAKDEESEK
ncbi:hypothetical protein [Catenulispora rubra]|uniref:hypothetical protein n=1 Tax=Catenulispora rubra TaxID=280293 RepID=UPI00189237DC|nr:hypothetical protein [Catenulispora rubra]